MKYFLCIAALMVLLSGCGPDDQQKANQVADQEKANPAPTVIETPPSPPQ